MALSHARDASSPYCVLCPPAQAQQVWVHRAKRMCTGAPHGCVQCARSFPQARSWESERLEACVRVLRAVGVGVCAYVCGCACYLRVCMRACLHACEEDAQLLPSVPLLTGPVTGIGALRAACAPGEHEAGACVARPVCAPIEVCAPPLDCTPVFAHIPQPREGLTSFRSGHKTGRA